MLILVIERDKEMEKNKTPKYSVRKSNDFIAAKYESSLIENQVMAIALQKIEQENSSVESELVARLYPNELKELISDQKHIYRDLKKLAKKITGHTMFLEDGKGNFKAFSLIPNAEYIDGVFSVKFNTELKNHVINLEKNYTNLELSVMTTLKKNASFRLYEVLKKEAYKIPKEKDACVKIEYGISELRFIMGLANIDNPIVKNHITNYNSNIDWDELYESIDKKEKKHDGWGDFRRRVIEPAQKELEEKSDIKFDFKGIRQGRKIKIIEFTIYRNTPTMVSQLENRKLFLDRVCKNNIIEEYKQIQLENLVSNTIYDEYIGHNMLQKEDIEKFMEVSNYNEDKVRDAIVQADNQAKVDNYVGWIINCIKNDNYGTSQNIETINGDSQQAEIVKEIKETAENIEFQESVWKKMTEKEEFGEFMDSLGIPLAVFEIAYDVRERMEMFSDWKINKMKNN